MSDSTEVFDLSKVKSTGSPVGEVIYSAGEPLSVDHAKVNTYYVTFVTEPCQRPDVEEVFVLGTSDGLRIPWPEGMTFTEAIMAWAAEQKKELAIAAEEFLDAYDDGGVQWLTDSYDSLNKLLGRESDRY